MKKTLRKIYFKTREYFLQPFKLAWIRIDYWLALLTDRPYFGGMYTAQMQTPWNRKSMAEFIKGIAHDDFLGMELGTWMGDSACIWGNELKNYKNARMFCIDAMYMSDSELASSHNKEQKKGLKKDRMVRLLLRNIKLSGLQDVVFLLKAPFQKVSSYFRHESLDFLYIDLGWTYEEQVDCLNRYLPLVKKGGWVCGDDYDSAHPYRTRAINEALGQVEVIDSFWYKQV